MTDLICALALTLLIEVPLGMLLLKSKRPIIPLILINVLTNPALNATLLILFSLTQSFAVYWTAFALGELAVFVGEGFLLRSLCNISLKRAIIVSTLLNACSLFLGSAIMVLI